MKTNTNFKNVFIFIYDTQRHSCVNHLKKSHISLIKYTIKSLNVDVDTRYILQLVFDYG